LHGVQHPDEAEVSGENAANAEVAGAPDVLDGVYQLIGAAVLEADDFACRGSRLRTGLKGGARSDEEANFNAFLVPDLGHLANLAARQQHDAASLADAMNRHLVSFGGFQHFAKHPRPFDTGNFNAKLSAVFEALRTRLQRVVVFYGQLELGEKLLRLFHVHLRWVNSGVTFASITWAVRRCQQGCICPAHTFPTCSLRSFNSFKCLV